MAVEGLPASFTSGFNADAFRDAVRNVMRLGLPPVEKDRATFRWTVKRTYDKQDPEGMPYDFSADPATEVTHPDVQIPVAVEFSARPAGSLDTPMGQFDISRAVLTIMDTDYPLVEGADQVILGGNTYDVDLWAPPMGLLSVQIYQVIVSAQDET